MIVCKFGGTSIGDAPAIRRLAGIVQSRLAERPLVVLSALSGVTNALLGLLKHTAPSEQRTLAHELAELVARHRQLARALELSEELGERIADEGQQLLARLAARPDPAGADELCDFVAAQGELWSTRLVAAALAAADLESVWVDARSVMRTDAHFTRAAPDRAVLGDLAPRQFLVLALAPLHRAFGVERVFVATMQAVSGAGYPGVASLDILGNVIPYIGQEEEKLQRETGKLLGELEAGAVREAAIALSAHCNRVPVEDGHTECVSVGLARRALPEAAGRVLAEFRAPAQVAQLPSSPEHPIEVELRPDRPQPLRDRDRGNGMTVTVGRVRACPLLDLRFTVLGHNRIRGAAGGAVQLGELLVAEGVVG